MISHITLLLEVVAAFVVGSTNETKEKVNVV